MTFPHQPVLKKQCLEAFATLSLPVFVDCTLGAGGHSEAFLQAHPEIETLVGIDQDAQSLRLAVDRLRPWESKVVTVRGNFDQLDQHLDALGIGQVQGILMDFGVSSMQLDQPARGFSFMRDGPLDMRMDEGQSLTAAEVVNTWSGEELGRIFREYGEEKQWRRAAQFIVEARKVKLLSTTRELVDLLHPALYRYSKKGIHPLTLIFQGLRICVNRELDVIHAVLPKAIERLASGGRLAVITFHSKEDRIVKQAFQYYASDKVDSVGLSGVFLDKEPLVNILTRKPEVAEPEEIATNPRSRSAKLRVIEKR